MAKLRIGVLYDYWWEDDENREGDKPRPKRKHSHDIQFPVIVKPAREDGSIGIHFGAVCGSIKELMERIDYIHVHFDSPALIEEYIEGRELYVAVLGNGRPEALPVVELDLSQL